LHEELGNRIPQKSGGTPQFGSVMCEFGSCVSRKSCGKTAISSAIRVQYQESASGVVQAHRFSDLLDDERTVELFVGRGQRLRSPGDADRIRLNDTNVF